MQSPLIGVIIESSLNISSLLHSEEVGCSLKGWFYHHHTRHHWHVLDMFFATERSTFQECVHKVILVKLCNKGGFFWSNKRWKNNGSCVNTCLRLLSSTWRPCVSHYSSDLLRQLWVKLGGEMLHQCVHWTIFKRFPWLRDCWTKCVNVRFAKIHLTLIVLP